MRGFAFWILGMCAFTSAAFAAAPKKEWTIFLYLAGDESEIKDASATLLKRFERVKSLVPEGKVQVVALFDDVDEGDPKKGDGLRYVLHHVDKPSKSLGPDTKEIPVETVRKQLKNPNFKYEDVDSGDPRTLKAYLKWGVENYPAEHYMLILSGHSWGQLGMMQDFYVKGEKLETSTMFKNYELHRVMKELYAEAGAHIPQGQFDLLLIDACTSGQLDVMMEVQDVFRYFMATSLETPFNSIPWDTVLTRFIPEVGKGNADEVFEKYFLKVLLEEYVKSHARDGSLVSSEKQIDAVAGFAVKNSRLGKVSDALKNLIAVLPNQARKEWKEGKLGHVEQIRDTDENGDLTAFARELKTYAESKKWNDVAAKSEALEKSLGYPKTDELTKKTKIAFDEFKNADSVWAHFEVDEVVPRWEVAACFGLKSFGLLNFDQDNLVPSFTKKDKTVKAISIRCNELAEEVRRARAQLPNGEAVPVVTLFGHKVSFAHRRRARFTEHRDKDGKVTKRVLSLFLPRAERDALNVRLSLVATEKVTLQYREGRKVLGEKPVTLPRYTVQDKFAEGSPLIVEAKTAGSAFKYGPGIFLGHDLPDDEWPYNGGRLPIEETDFKNSTLEKYFAQLEKDEELDTQKIKGKTFYRRHRIESTGWPKFVFGLDVDAPARSVQPRRTRFMGRQFQWE